MKILLVSQYYFPERFSVSDIAETLGKQGHEVSVLTGKPNYGMQHILKEYKHVKYEEINGVKVHRVNLYPRKYSRLSIVRNYLSFHRNAKRYVRHFKEEFDVVLSISLSPVISVSPALLYAKKHHVPCVLYCQDLWPESTVVTNAVRKGSLIYRFLYKWSKSIYNRCDRIVVSSPTFKEYFENELNIHDKVFNCVNQPILMSNKHLDPIKYEKDHHIVYAGNIGKIQLTDLLAESMKYVKSNVKLHLMGMGSELESIKQLIISEHLEDKVIYEGAYPIEKAEAYYWNADALIVSLKSEGYVGKTIPNKAIQYMKYGRPILAIISGDAKTMLENAKGSVFAGENAKNIAENIDILCNKSEKEKDQLGLNNKRYFEENFSIEKLTELLAQELIEVKKWVIDSDWTLSP